MKIDISRDSKVRIPTQAERRRYPRLPVVFGALATLGKSKFGIITDISCGGLAFRYIAFGHKDQFLMEEPAITITYNIAGFAMLNIPCQIVRDFSRTADSYPGAPIKKTCCVEFDSLTPEQKLQLEFFITHYTDKGSSRPDT